MPDLDAERTAEGQVRCRFRFDDEVVALSADPLTERGKVPVDDGGTDGALVADAALRSGDEAIVADGAVVADRPGERERLRGTRWVHVEGIGGTVIRSADQAAVARAQLNGEARFRLWLRGDERAPGQYDCLLLPNADLVETAVQARRPAIETLVNRPAVQAVRQLGTGVLAVQAWEPAEVSVLRTDSPATVVVSEGPSELAVRVRPVRAGRPVRARLAVSGSAVLAADPGIRVRSTTPLLFDFDGRTREAELRLRYRPWCLDDVRALVDRLWAAGEVERELATSVEAEVEAIGSATAPTVATGLVHALRAELRPRKGHQLSADGLALLDDAVQRLACRVGAFQRHPAGQPGQRAGCPPGGIPEQCEHRGDQQAANDGRVHQDCDQHAHSE